MFLDSFGSLLLTYRVFLLLKRGILAGKRGCSWRETRTRKSAMMKFGIHVMSTLMGSELCIYRYVVSPSLGYNITLPRDFFSKMPSFDLHCRYALLTYAQSGDLSGETVGTRLSEMGFESVVGRENHADGGVHLHCFVDFGRKRRFRRFDVFDVQGRHPNINPIKVTPHKAYEYATKDGDIVFQSLDKPEVRGGAGKTVAVWATITNAGSREEFWSLVHELDPKSAACNHTQLQKYCDWKFSVEPPKYESPGGITFIGGSDGRDSWLSQSGIGVGESPIGTCFQWAERVNNRRVSCLKWELGARPSLFPRPIRRFS